MKQVLLAFFLIMAASSVQAACSSTSIPTGGNWVCVQAATGATATMTGIAAGDLITVSAGSCVNAGCGSQAGALTGVTGTLEGAYTCPAGTILNGSVQGRQIGICYFCNASAGTDVVTPTWSSTHFYDALLMEEWHNTAGAFSCSGIAETSGNTTGSGINPSVAATGSTTHANELIYAYLVNSDSSSTQGAGFTLLQNPGGSNLTEAQNGATSQTYTATWTNANSGSWVSAILTFIPPSVSSVTQSGAFLVGP